MGAVSSKQVCRNCCSASCSRGGSRSCMRKAARRRGQLMAPRFHPCQSHSCCKSRCSANHVACRIHWLQLCALFQLARTCMPPFMPAAAVQSKAFKHRSPPLAAAVRLVHSDAIQPPLLVHLLQLRSEGQGCGTSMPTEHVEKGVPKMRDGHGRAKTAAAVHTRLSCVPDVKPTATCLCKKALGVDNFFGRDVQQAQARRGVVHLLGDGGRVLLACG